MKNETFNILKINKKNVTTILEVILQLISKLLSVMMEQGLEYPFRQKVEINTTLDNPKIHLPKIVYKDVY